MSSYDWAEYSTMRDPLPRYKLFEREFAQFRRPFSLLDFGANAGYFSQWASRDYGCFPVCVEKHGVKYAEAFPCIGGMQAAKLAELVRGEHFDVTLALNVLHHFTEDWELVLAALLDSATTLVLEYPGPDEEGCLNATLATEQHRLLSGLEQTVLGQTPAFSSKQSRTLSVVRTRKRSVERGSFYYSRRPILTPLKPMSYEVHATPLAKSVRGRPWVHGVNLWSAVQAGLLWPSREWVVARLEKPRQHHGDIRPWNYVLNHEGVWLIDCDDAKRYHADDVEAYEETRRWVLHGGPIG